jgi:DNA adenine methylase
MKPIFRYSGGKGRELKRINDIISEIEFNRIVEPFVGGGAFAFSQEKPSLISDIRSNNIDVYKAVADEEQFKYLLKKVDELRLVTDKKQLGKEFYYWRDKKYKNCNALWEKAFRWIIIRQLCYSGMDRVNQKTGKFNVPYGWYPKFTTKLNQEHHDLLKTWEIKECSFETSIKNTGEDDFIFLDPPYLERSSDYGSGDHSLKLHEDLFECLKNTKAKWLLIHTRHPFYEKTYVDYNTLSKDFKYSSQWSAKKTKSDPDSPDYDPDEKAISREQKNRKVEHLYITNFQWGEEINNLENFMKKSENKA